MQILLLVAASALTAALHTLVPDHWAPYVVTSQARSWNVGKSMRVTTIGTTVHLASTAILGILIGLVGLELSPQFGQQADFWASWLLVAFGLYFTWRGWQSHQQGGGHAHGGHSHGHGHEHGHEQVEHEAHEHSHDHEHEAAAAHEHTAHAHVDDHDHGHQHDHGHEHAAHNDHAHDDHGHEHVDVDQIERSEWALGTILGIRPCAESIPIFITAATLGLVASLATIATWVVATFICSLGIVWLSLKGLERFNLPWVERNGDLAAGVMITVLGLIMVGSSWI